MISSRATAPIRRRPSTCCLSVPALVVSYRCSSQSSRMCQAQWPEKRRPCKGATEKRSSKKPRPGSSDARTGAECHTACDVASSTAGPEGLLQDVLGSLGDVLRLLGRALGVLEGEVLGDGAAALVDQHRDRGLLVEGVLRRAVLLNGDGQGRGQFVAF